MLVVTGPPRSGTSLVCNLLQQIGCDFGDEELLLAGNQWNELGYFENTEVVSLNQRLIIGSWLDAEPWTVSVWPEGRFERFRRLMVLLIGRATMTSQNILRRSKKMAAEMEALQHKYAGCTVKDPRFCFTLPAWGRSVDRVLFCVRNPREVAQSMAKQSGFAPAIGFYAWHRWQRWFWRHEHPYPVHFVDYNRLVSEEGFEEEFRRLLAFAQMPCDDARAQEIRQRTVRSDLHHNRAAEDPLPFIIQGAYDELRGRHRRATPPEAPRRAAAQ